MKASVSFLCLVLLGWAPVAMADVAPNPVRIDGSTRMTEETVDIVVEKDVARVTAKFTLEIGDIQKLRYCRALQEGGSECGDWYYHFELSWPLLDSQDGAFKEFSVKVNGEEADVWGDEEEEVPGLTPPISKWIRISAPRMDKRPTRATVEVRYVEALSPRLGLARLTYVLRSGSLWKGTIGAATITMTAADGIVLQNAAPAPKSAGPARLVWKFKNFEPDQDISVTVRLPLSAEDEEWRRKYEELVRKNAELDAKDAELRIEEDKLEATYQEYLKALDELKKKEQQEQPVPKPQEPPAPPSREPPAAQPPEQPAPTPVSPETR